MKINIEKKYIYVLLTILIVGFSYIVYSQAVGEAYHTASQIFLSDGRSLEIAINPSSPIQEVNAPHPASQIFLLDGRSVEMAYIPTNDSQSMGKVFHPASKVFLLDNRSVETAIQFLNKSQYISLTPNPRDITVYYPKSISSKIQVAIPKGKTQITIPANFTLADWGWGWPSDEVIKLSVKVGNVYSDNCTINRATVNCEGSDSIESKIATCKYNLLFPPVGCIILNTNFTISNPPSGVQNVSVEAVRVLGPLTHTVGILSEGIFVKQQNVGYSDWII